jgi:hypothetical protein
MKNRKPFSNKRPPGTKRDVSVIFTWRVFLFDFDEFFRKNSIRKMYVVFFM